MTEFKKALTAYGDISFENALISEIEQLGVKELPLQQGLTHSSYALDNNIKAIIINVFKETNIIRVKAGLFYTGIIAGCNCADDPTPTDEQQEYCEVQININSKTADTEIVLISE